MTKVCHMTSAHSPEDVRIFHKESVSLSKAGYEVYLVARGDSYEKYGVHIVGAGMPLGGRIFRMTTFAKKIYKTALDLGADIYHFHDPELLPYGLKLKKKGKIVIFDSHENTLDQIQEKIWIPKPLRYLVYKLFCIYQKKVTKELNAVVSVTPHICEYFKQFSPRVYMISNFPIYDENYQQPKFQNAALCFAGGVNGEHQFPEVLEALNEIDNITFNICGYGNPKFLNNLQKHPAWTKVCYFGRMAHAKVKEIYRESSIGVAITPYSHNSGGTIGTLGNTKIYEIMMAGLPVICTDYKLWKEMIKVWNCGICVNPYSSVEISAAIRSILENFEMARSMGENGRRAVKEKFNWETEEKTLLRLYGEVLQK